MKIMALENYQESIPEDDNIVVPENDLIADSGEDVPEVNPSEIETEENNISQAFHAADALENIAAAVEGCESGLSPAAGRALMVAVEHISKLRIGSMEKTKLPCFEEFSTKKHQKETSLESLEAIKKIGTHIWEMIIRAIDRLVEMFKNYFFGQITYSKAIEKEADSLGKAAKEAKAKPKHVPENNEPTATVGNVARMIRSKRIFTVLNINGKVPAPEQLVQEVKNHFVLMSKYDYAFNMVESTVLKCLSAALREIHKDGDQFQEAISTCQSEICTNNIGRKMQDQRSFGELDQGYAIYEAPLIFGGKAFYRTGITSGVTISEDKIRFFISDATGAKTDFEIEPIEELSDDQCIHLAALTKERVERLNKTLYRRDKNTQLIESMKKDILRIRDNKSSNERSARRARVFFHVLNMYFKYRETMSGRMVAYDQKVCNAILSYVSASITKSK